MPSALNGGIEPTGVGRSAALGRTDHSGHRKARSRRCAMTAASNENAPDQPGHSTSGARDRQELTCRPAPDDQRHSEGRYFEASVVPAPLQAQTIEPDGGVPAASAAPPEVGTIAMALPVSIFVP